MKKNTLFFPVLFVLVLLASCTAGPNLMEGQAGNRGETAGFLMGLWHGGISCISFIISLFNDKVSVYEVHNNGGWYNFGFILGIMIAYGGGGSGAKCGKCRK